MGNGPSGRATVAELRNRALSGWVNEGGARAPNPGIDGKPPDTQFDEPDLTSAEAVHLRVRARHSARHGAWLDD